MPILTDRAELSALASGDFFHIVDVSDTSGDPAGTSKKIQASNIGLALNAAQAITLGVGIARTEGTLHVHTASAGAVTASPIADDLVVENSAAGGISILTPDNFTSALVFGSPSVGIGAVNSWNHDANEMLIGSSKTGASMKITSGFGVEAITINATQDVTIPAGSLTVTADGLIMGAPTGGDKGAGTINVATDVFKNNSAYTNPDYALEHWATGRNEEFKDNPGASEYKGIIPLSQLGSFMKKHYHLPGIQKKNEEGVGIFDRADRVLEKVEEAFIYLTQLNGRLTVLELA